MQISGVLGLGEGEYTSRHNPGTQSYLESAKRASSGPFALIRLFVLLVIPFVIVDGGINQLEMLVAGGRAPITPAVLKIALLVSLAAAAFLRFRIRSSMLLNAGLILAAYLVADLLFLYFYVGADFSDIIISYNIYYMIFFIDVIAFCVPLNISDRLLVRIVIICFLICAPLGFAQYLTQRPIVPTESGDGNFRVLVWNAAGGIRAFSLFTAPGFFGMFSAFIAAMSVAMYGRGRNWFFALPLLGMSIFACWISLTRTDLIGLACALTTACVLTFSRKKKRGRWLPLLYLPVGVLVGIYAYIQSASGSGTRSITDTSTFTERLYEWSYYIASFTLTKWPTMLFGSGLVQSEKVQTNAAIVPIDNLYLAVVLHTGLIGLALTMGLFWIFWETIRNRAESRTSYIHTAVAASFSALWCSGLFQVGSTALGAIVLLSAVSKTESTSTP